MWRFLQNSLSGQAIGGIPMAIIAYGAEQVRALQHALGGSLPAQAGKQPRMRLDKFVAERFKVLRSEREAAARLATPIRDRLFSHIPKEDVAVKRSIAETRKFFERRLKRKIPQPETMRIEPRFITGSNFWIKVPPYDDAWTFNPPHTNAGADKVAGNYNMAVQSFGDGSCEAAAGIAVWFFCTASDPMQRVAAVLDYSDDWWDAASGYVAHNDLRTRIWIWGNTEQNWLARSDLQPSWSDGVGWWEDHGNHPAGDSGRIAIETFFPAEANQWYLAWIWSDASVYADGGIFGAAGSSIQFSAAVPLVVFGSLS
jgi:hypothetical protein